MDIKPIAYSWSPEFEDHERYIFAIIVGKYQRSLIQYFKEEYQHIMSSIPGVQAMQDKFK
ncbi:MAG: hypothetical protein GTO24_24985 [candidate division Zixibacteria bacterium]|nr:hypothetical protein [candidate division Zixibacteria bacterium]